MSRLTLVSLSIVLFAVSAYAKRIPIRLIDLSTPYTNGTEQWGPEDYSFAEQALADQLAAVEQYYHPKQGYIIVGFGDASAAWGRVYIRNQCIWFNGEA